MFSKRIKSFLKDYFTLTSRERRGAMALVFLILTQIIVLLWMRFLFSPDEPIITRNNLVVETFVKQIQERESEEKKHLGNNFNSGLSTLKPEKLFNFNPNEISDSSWMLLGLSVKQTSIVRNFLNKGGEFRKKEDLSKIYGITPAQYEMLEPYIKIPVKENYSNKETWEKKEPKKEFIKVNINTADTIELVSLPLVGPGRARLIYRYRESLGGFVEVKQLFEVFGMDSAAVAVIQPKIMLDKTAIRKTNLNSDELRHPYISRQLAAAIKAFRKQHGNFSELDDLKRMELMNDELLFKLAPYAAFE